MNFEKGKRYKIFLHDNPIPLYGNYLGQDYVGRWQFDARPDHGTFVVSQHMLRSSKEEK